MLRRSGGFRSPRSVAHRVALAALVANVGIVVTGGAVRLTASGLGCPTVPRCTDTSLVPTAELGVHGAIEFGNRLLTVVLTGVVVLCVVTMRRQRPARPALVRLAFLLLAGIAGQVLLGAVTVLTGLNPVTVMAHFLLSMTLVGVAVLLVERTGDGDGPARPVVRPELLLTGRLLLGVVALTLIAGTVVTGTGPHSGDREATHRLPFDLATVTQLHADLVFLTLGLLGGLLLALRATGSPVVVQRRAAALLAVVLAQGLVGYTQYFTDLPVALVAVHVLGACLVWVAAVRLLLAMNAREPLRARSPAPSANAGDRVTY